MAYNTPHLNTLIMVIFPGTTLTAGPMTERQQILLLGMVPLHPLLQISPTHIPTGIQACTYLQQIVQLHVHKLIPLCCSMYTCQHNTQKLDSKQQCYH